MPDNLSVPTQSPLVGLNMDPDTATYVGVLEGTIAALVINECKYRALLELFTGESWEATRIDINGQTLMDLAVSTLVKQTGMDLAKARTLVRKRWNTYNQELPAVVPQAVSVAEMAADDRPLPDAVATGDTTTQAVAMSSRLQEWKRKQLAAAAEVEPPGG